MGRLPQSIPATGNAGATFGALPNSPPQAVSGLMGGPISQDALHSFKGVELTASQLWTPKVAEKETCCPQDLSPQCPRGKGLDGVGAPVFRAGTI